MSRGSVLLCHKRIFTSIVKRIDEIDELIKCLIIF